MLTSPSFPKWLFLHKKTPGTSATNGVGGPTSDVLGINTYFLFNNIVSHNFWSVRDYLLGRGDRYLMSLILLITVVECYGHETPDFLKITTFFTVRGHQRRYLLKFNKNSDFEIK